MPRQITAFSNPLVKDVRALRDKKGRRRQGMFLAEGLRILAEARQAGKLPAILFYAAGTDNPQTVLGVYRAFDTALGRIDRAEAPLWIVAQALRDPGNLGTILRT